MSGPISARGNLRNGIRLFAGSIERSEAPRVWLSSGTSRAVERITAVRYSEDALIPSPPWRVPTLDEGNLLWTREAPRDWRECVGLVRIPDGIMAPFSKLYIDLVNTEEDYKALTNHPDYEEALTWVFEYIKLFCLSEQYDLQMIGLSFNHSGLDTVTFDMKSNCYIGLHFDSWDRLPLRQRHEARNRICINMGREDRFLLLINLSAADIVHLLQETQHQEVQKRGWWSRVIPKSTRYHDYSAEAYARMGATSVGQEFMKYYPEYPVIKLRIAPREAYIAPTENMIHDGCTAGKDHPDLKLTFLGHFGIGQEAAARSRLDDAQPGEAATAYEA